MCFMTWRGTQQVECNNGAQQVLGLGAHGLLTQNGGSVRPPYSSPSADHALHDDPLHDSPPRLVLLTPCAPPAASTTPGLHEPDHIHSPTDGAPDDVAAELAAHKSTGDAVAALERRLAALTITAKQLTTLSYDKMSSIREIHEQRLRTAQPSAPLNTMRPATSSRSYVDTTGPLPEREGALAGGQHAGLAATASMAVVSTTAIVVDRGATSTGGADDGAGTLRATASSFGASRSYRAQAGPADAPLAFSLPALKELGLALGTKGLSLSVLVLDHNHLGDQGAAMLAGGLQRCSSLKHLSLAYCGISALGARALGTIFVADEAMKKGNVPAPALLHLNVAGNPLGGAGLMYLCGGVSSSMSLQVLNLFGIGVGEGDSQALQVLGTTLVLCPTLQQVDFDGNYIGDAGALQLAPLVEGATHVKKFRHTHRLGAEAARALTDAVWAHSGGRKKAKGKKATAAADAKAGWTPATVIK